MSKRNLFISMAIAMADQNGQNLVWVTPTVLCPDFRRCWITLNNKWFNASCIQDQSAIFEWIPIVIAIAIAIVIANVIAIAIGTAMENLIAVRVAW